MHTHAMYACMYAPHNYLFSLHLYTQPRQLVLVLWSVVTRSYRKPFMRSCRGRKMWEEAGGRWRMFLLLHPMSKTI